MTSQSGQDSSVTINSKRVVSKRPGHSVTPFVCPTNVYTKGKGSRYAVFHFFSVSEKSHPRIRNCHADTTVGEITLFARGVRAHRNSCRTIWWFHFIGKIWQILKLCVICLTRGLYFIKLSSAVDQWEHVFNLQCCHRSNWSTIILWSLWYFSTIRKIQIPLGFPSGHPYASHMPQFQVFPSLESPDDIRKGKQAVMLQPTLPPTVPASAPDPSVLEKTKGHFNRREMVSVQRESERTPLIWPEHNLLQVILQ